jgi:hypothetical protein
LSSLSWPSRDDLNMDLRSFFLDSLGLSDCDLVQSFEGAICFDLDLTMFSLMPAILDG